MEAATLMDENVATVLESWPVATAFGRDAADRAIRVYTRAGERAKAEPFAAQIAAAQKEGGQ
jgi:hypothetical protein